MQTGSNKALVIKDVMSTWDDTVLKTVLRIYMMMMMMMMIQVITHLSHVEVRDDNLTKP